MQRYPWCRRSINCIQNSDAFYFCFSIIRKFLADIIWTMSCQIILLHKAIAGCKNFSCYFLAQLYVFSLILHKLEHHLLSETKIYIFQSRLFLTMLYHFLLYFFFIPFIFFTSLTSDILTFYWSIFLVGYIKMKINLEIKFHQYWLGKISKYNGLIIFEIETTFHS